MSQGSASQSQMEEDEQNSRLNSIWQSIKQTKNMSQMYRHDLQNKQGQIRHHGRTQHHSFVRSRRKSPEQDRDYQNNLAHLLKKLQELDKQNEYLRQELELSKVKAAEQLQSQHKDFESKLKHQLRKLKTIQKQNICEQRQDKHKVSHLMKQVERLNLKIKSLQFEKRGKQQQLQKLQSLNIEYSKILQENQEKYNSKIIIGQGKGEQLLELSEANATIQRLIDLLKRTQEYREYASLIEQAKQMHYLKNILKRLKGNQLNAKLTTKKPCSCSQVKMNEKLLWSPAQCYKLMLGLKLKYDYLSQDCIEEVLFEMNRIYTSKEDKQIKKVRNSYQNELTRLKKKFEESYDELLAKKQITRLKKQLRNVKSAHKVKPQNKIEGLKNRGQYEDQLKLKEREVKLLQQRIKLFQTENGFYDKSLYYEGALWMVEKVLDEIQSNEGSLKEFEIIFRQRLDYNMQPEDWLRSYKEFFERVGQLNADTLDKLMALKQSAIRKMGQKQ